MKKEIIYPLIALILVAGLAFAFWPKGTNKDGLAALATAGQNQNNASQGDNLNIEFESVSNTSTASTTSDNQNNKVQTNMGTKLDGNVKNEITAASGPAMQIDANKIYTAVLKTSVGDITIQLNAKSNPITVNNFIYLARKGFYGDTVFHRIINGFMIQGGDPIGNGTGGPGYKFNDENLPTEYNYARGTIAMANAGPNTNGSQFFIMHKDYLLSPNYVIFGKVTEGLNVVDKIAQAQAKANAYGEISVPLDPVKITSVDIYQAEPTE
ncbi:MAG: peptidylprolyl isomerase [Candidatus Paceibacterota bacterium]|jgi:cyclophilin family peptidyl-prolyl cis-trans isomerase